MRSIGASVVLWGGAGGGDSDQGYEEIVAVSVHVMVVSSGLLIGGLRKAVG